MEFKKYLNEKPVSNSNFKLLDVKDFHPILIGRLFSIKLLSNEAGNDGVGKFLEFINKSDNEKYNNLLAQIKDLIKTNNVI